MSPRNIDRTALATPAKKSKGPFSDEEGLGERATPVLFYCWRFPWRPTLAPPETAGAGACRSSAPISGCASFSRPGLAWLSLLTALPMILLIAWRRRAFCRYCCPLGLLNETAGKIRRKPLPSYARIPKLGVAFCLLSLGGASLGLPFFLFLDPLGVYLGACSLTSAWPYAVLLAGILLSAMALPGLWCSRLCPLGALQDLTAATTRLRQRQGAPLHSGIPLARRAFLGVGGGLAGAWLAPHALAHTTPAPLRPPGASDEILFRALCLRCGSCVRACPSGILTPDRHPVDPSAILLPKVDFSQGHCLEDCARCGAACPTNAIAALGLPAKNDAKIGLAHIDQSNCLLFQERDCSACRVICPRQAITEGFSEETYTVTIKISAMKCNGCGACVAACPPKAITIQPI